MCAGATPASPSSQVDIEMVKDIIVVLVASCLSGGLYHISGIGGFKGAKLIRRGICPLLALGLFFALKTPQIRHIWAYQAFLILNFGAMSTYCSTLVKPDDDVVGIEWFFTGALYGLAALPLIWCGVHLWAIIIRSVFLAISIMWLREKTGKVAVEEIGSGALYCLTIPLLLL